MDQPTEKVSLTVVQKLKSQADVFSTAGLAKIANLRNALRDNEEGKKYNAKESSPSSHKAVESAIDMLTATIKKENNNLLYFEENSDYNKFQEAAILDGEVLPEIYNQHTLDMATILLRHMSGIDIKKDLTIKANIGLSLKGTGGEMSAQERLQATCIQLESSIVRYQLMADYAATQVSCDRVKALYRELKEDVQKGRTNIDHIGQRYSAIIFEYNQVRDKLPAIGLVSNGYVNRDTMARPEGKPEIKPVAGELLLGLVGLDQTLREAYGDKAPHAFMDIAAQELKNKPSPAVIKSLEDLHKELTADIKGILVTSQKVLPSLEAKIAKLEGSLAKERENLKKAKPGKEGPVQSKIGDIESELSSARQECDQLKKIHAGLEKLGDEVAKIFSNKDLGSSEVALKLYKALDSAHQDLGKSSEICGRLLNKQLLVVARIMPELTVTGDNYATSKLEGAVKAFQPQAAAAISQVEAKKLGNK